MKIQKIVRDIINKMHLPQNFKTVIINVGIISCIFLLASYFLFNWINTIDNPFKEALSLTITLFGGLGTLYAVLISFQTIDEENKNNENNNINLIRKAQPILKISAIDLKHSKSMHDETLSFDLIFLCFKNDCYAFEIDIDILNQHFEKNLDTKHISKKNLLILKELNEECSKIILGASCWENQITKIEDKYLNLVIKYIDKLQNKVTSKYSFQFVYDKNNPKIIELIEIKHLETIVTVGSNQSYKTSDYLNYSRES